MILIKMKKKRKNYNVFLFTFVSTGQAHHGQVSYISPPIHLDSELERPPVRGESLLSFLFLFSFFFLYLNKRKLYSFSDEDNY